MVQIRRGEIDEEALTESQEQEGMLLKKEQEKVCTAVRLYEMTQYYSWDDVEEPSYS